MNAVVPWYVSERAENTVVLLLTDFDVAAQRNNAATGPDLRVYLNGVGEAGDFFVEVKGTSSIDKWIDEDNLLRADLCRDLRRTAAGIKKPVAIMLVDVKKTVAYLG